MVKLRKGREKTQINKIRHGKGNTIAASKADSYWEIIWKPAFQKDGKPGIDQMLDTHNLRRF